MIEIEVTGDAEKWLDHYWAKGILNMEQIAINRVAPEAERYMKLNAPWKDRTGNARAGLTATYSRDRRNDEFTIALSYRNIDYDVHLEYGMSGRFSILRPTAEALFPKMVEEYWKAWL